MKYIYLIIFAVPFFLVGCSSIYTVKDFSSKEKFYDDFNKFAKDKDLEITLLNDSSFSTGYGAVIINDKLVINDSDKNLPAKNILLNSVKTVSYKNRLLGAVIGLPTGAVAGFGFGLFATGGDSREDPKANKIFNELIIAGPIIGAILGSIIGYTYTYYFNP